MTPDIAVTIKLEGADVIVKALKAHGETLRMFEETLHELERVKAENQSLKKRLGE